MSPRSVRAAMALVVLVLLAACSGGGSSAATTSTSGTTTTASADPLIEYQSASKDVAGCVGGLRNPDCNPAGWSALDGIYDQIAQRFPSAANDVRVFHDEWASFRDLKCKQGDTSTECGDVNTQLVIRFVNIDLIVKG